MKITEPGIYEGFDIEAYHQDPCPTPSLSQSIAKILIDRSPAHAAAEHPRLALASEVEETPDKYIAAQAIGDAAHGLLIGRGKQIAVGDFPDWRKKDAQTFKEEALAAGKTPILAKHFMRAEAMVTAARSQLDAVGWKDAYREGAGEVVLAWQERGLWFRSLVDWLVDTAHPVDLKTTSLSVAPHAIPNLMANASWDIQAAMYERGLDALDPDNAGRRRFRFVALENEPPFALTPVEIGEATLTIGRKKLQFAIDIWRRCMEADVWPSYPAEVCRPDYPQWMESRWLSREVAEADAKPRNGQLQSLMGG